MKKILVAGIISIFLGLLCGGIIFSWKNCPLWIYWLTVPFSIFALLLGSATIIKGYKNRSPDILKWGFIGIILNSFVLFATSLYLYFYYTLYI